MLRKLTAALVAACMLALTACGGSGSRAVTVTMTPDAVDGGDYNPSVLHIHSGDQVTWVEEDHNKLHTVTARDNSFGSKFLAYGQRYTLRFNHPGTYQYFCEIHPRMTGEVVVK